MLSKKIFIKYKQFIIYHDKLFDKIYENATINNFDATRGGDLIFSDKQNNEFSIPHLYSGKSVHEYYIDYDNISFTTKGEIKTGTSKVDYENELLVSTKIYHYPRAIIKPKYYTIGAGIIKIDILNKLIQQKYALAILNSKVIKYICYRYLVNFSQLTTNLNTGQLPLIPLKEINQKDQEPFIDLVDKIISITKSKDYIENKRSCEEVKKIQERIDKLIYALYDLTPEEIKVVEKSNE